MPLPKPTKEEDKNAFVSRCMSDETMKKDFTDNKQRVAVCLSQFSRKNPKASISQEGDKIILDITQNE